MNKSKLICFIATSHPSKSRDFYNKRLGLKLISEDSFALEFNAYHSMLRIQKVNDFVPVQRTVLGWEIKNIKNKVNQLKKRGVKFNRYKGMSQDENRIWTSPSGAKVAWFRDPDGNVLSLTQFK